MSGWLTDILAREQNPAVTTPVEPGRDVTQRRRPVDVQDIDLYTGNVVVETGHRYVYVGNAAAVSVQARTQGSGTGGAVWANRIISVQRVIGGRAVAFASAKSLTPAAPACEITAAELGGADTICIVPAASGSVDAQGVTARVTVTMQEDVTPASGVVATTIDAGRVRIAGGGASVQFGE